DWGFPAYPARSPSSWTAMTSIVNTPWVEQLSVEWKRSQAFAVGIFDCDGGVLYANQGMDAVLELTQGNRNPASYFQSPPFERFVGAAESEEPVYTGLITVGSAHSPGIALRGRVFHRDGQVLVVCEPDTPALVRAHRELGRLFEEVSNLQRQLLK